MSVYFIDITEFEFDKSLVKEICIIKSSNVFKPIYQIGRCVICRTCILQKVNVNSIFYVDEKSYDLVKMYFPSLRLISYECQLQVPSNISCFWNEHENCAYKNCIRICIDYLNDKE